MISVGRLDFNTEGLLLLTNDGELARYLEKPANAMVRRYRVRVHGRVNEDDLAALKEGPVIEGVQYGSVEAILDVQKGANAWINLSIREGKNREVRRIMESLGYDVTRLIRTDYGPIQLGKLPRGEMEEVPRKALVEWFGGKVAGITASKSGSKEGFAVAKDRPKFKGPRKDKKTEDVKKTRKGENRMRIVGGKFKGRKLVAPEGLDTRPTSDRARESVFNILEHQTWGRAALRGGRVLDVFSGTGALGWKPFHVGRPM